MSWGYEVSAGRKILMIAFAALVNNVLRKSVTDWMGVAF